MILRSSSGHELVINTINYVALISITDIDSNDSNNKQSKAGLPVIISKYIIKNDNKLYLDILIQIQIAHIVGLPDIITCFIILNEYRTLIK